MKPSLQVAHFGIRKTWEEAMADLNAVACTSGRIVALYPPVSMADNAKLPEAVGWLAVPDSHNCFACGQYVPPVKTDAS